MGNAAALSSHAAAAAWRRFSLRAFCHNAIIIVAKKFFNHRLSPWTHISARLWLKSAFASCSFTIDYTIYQSESQCKYLFTGANYTQTHKHIDKSALTSFNSVYFGIHCFWLWFALTSDIILNGIERHNNSNNNNETRKAALPNLYLINALNVCVCTFSMWIIHGPALLLNLVKAKNDVVCVLSLETLATCRSHRSHFDAIMQIRSKQVQSGHSMKIAQIKVPTLRSRIMA